MNLPSPTPSALSVLLLALAEPVAAGGQVLVVDDDGGAGVAFTDIQPAVLAAAEGDTVLVAAGTYGSFTISGRSLVVAADAGAAVKVFGRVEVNSVSPDQRVALRGLEILVPVFAKGVQLLGNQGPVWIEDCLIRNGNLGQGEAPEGVLVADSAPVVFARCQLFGSTAGQPGAGSGLVARNSFVHLYDSLLEGGAGALGDMGHGGHGARVDGGLLYAAGTTFLAADGGNGVTIQIPGFTFCKDAGDGGHGLLLEETAFGPPAAVLRDVVLQSGLGGKASDPVNCSNGQDGSPTAVLAGSLSTLPGTSRSFSIGSPVRAGQPAALSFGGEPGDLVILATAPAPGGVILPGQPDPFLLDPFAPFFVFLGAVPAGGELLVNAVTAPIAGGQESVAAWMQGAFLSPGLELVLGSPSVLSLLDPAF